MRSSPDVPDPTVVSPSAASAPRPVVVDVVLIASLLALRVWFNAPRLDWWYDGNYYADIARHVAAGHGFVSSLSMYHAGFPSFPFPSAVYPLWPLLLGLVAKVVPLEVAGVWLPTVLYLATAWVSALAVRRMLPARPFEGLPLDGGHLALLAWGLANRFVEATARPYTEGLGMLLLALALLRVGTSRVTLAAGVEAGLWCALLLAARGPFVVPVAVILGGLWLAEGRLRRALPATLVLGACLVLADQLWFRRIPGATIATLFRFDHWVVTPGLSTVDLFVKPMTLGELALDRLRGFEAAYDPAGEYRLSKNFGFLAFIPWLLVLPAFAKAAWRSARESLLVRLALGVGFGQLALLHVLHKQAFAEWNFALRHALPILWAYLALLPAALDPSIRAFPTGRLARALVTALVAAGLAQGLEMTVQRRSAMILSTAEATPRIRAAEWMLARTKEDPDLRIGHPSPQLVTRHAPGVGFIAVHPFTTLDDVRVMVRTGGMDYLVLPTGGGKYAFLADRAAFDALFEPVAKPPKGSIVYRPRPD